MPAGATDASETATNASETATAHALRFKPVASSLDDSFLSACMHLKLESLRLSEEATPCMGWWRHGVLQLSGWSLEPLSTSCTRPHSSCSLSRGMLYVYNTEESMLAASKHALLEGAARIAWEAAQVGGDTLLLSPFVVLFHWAESPRRFLSWVGVPTLVVPCAHSAICMADALAPVLTPCAHPPQLAALLAAVEHSPDAGAHPVLVACRMPSLPVLRVAWAAADAARLAWTVCTLAALDARLATATAEEAAASRGAATFCIRSSAGALDWPARNALTAVGLRCKPAERVRLLVYCAAADAASPLSACPRDLACLGHAAAHTAAAWRVSFSSPPLVPAPAALPAALRLPPPLRTLGWEAQGGRLEPRRSQPQGAAVSLAASQLHLSLMQWRAAPGLDPARIQSTRALLLGAGTLGCSVARALVAWGCKRITLVDSGAVSFSNPSRQCLYEHATIGSLKAPAAAAALVRIDPSVSAVGIVLRIPSGPALGEPGSMLRDVETLEELVRGSDVVFLLTDSRASRWLPSLMCAAQGVACITVAVAFDMGLVMRHAGGGAGCLAPAMPGQPPLACYFCASGAPFTTASQPLDQACTLARCGLAPCVSALAVEMLIAALHQPQGLAAASWPGGASPSSAAPEATPPLGLVPGQLRILLQSLTIAQATLPPAPTCTACSPAILRAFQQGGSAWVAEVLNNARDGCAQLESISGFGAETVQVDEAMIEGWLATG